MRLFPGDDVPDLAAFSQEMPSPWLMPRGLSRRHRDRLGALVARAVRVFDPKVRCIQLRWVEAPYVRDGRIKLPERVLVWWRSDTLVEEPANVLREAPKVVHGLHLLDLDRDPGVEALGWLAPLKVRLLHKLTDALLELGIEVDPEPLIDALNDASVRLVSPIDLLDFTERLVEARTTGLRLEEARAEAIALVLAERMAPGPVKRIDVQQLAAAMERAAQPGPLPPATHSLLLLRGLAELDPAARPPVLDWFAFPGVYARALRRLQMHAIASASATPSISPKNAVLAADQGLEGAKAPSKKTDENALQALENRAKAVLDAVRQGEERDWPVNKKAEAAALLRVLATELGRMRGDLRAAPLVEREAAVLEVAAQLWEDAAQPELAAMDWLDAAERSMMWNQSQRAQKASRKALSLVGKTANKQLEARIFKVIADILAQSGSFVEGKQAYDSALDLYHVLGDSIGEANTLRSIGELALRNGDFVSAQQTFDAALSIFRSSGEPLGEANTLCSLGVLAMRNGDLVAARQAYDAALVVCRDIGYRLGEANVLRTTGELAMWNGDLAAAKQANDAALSIYRILGERLGEANSLSNAGELALRIGDLSVAKQAHGAALSLYRILGEELGEAIVLNRAGALAIRNGDFAAAKQSYDASLRLSRILHARVDEADALRGLAVVDLLEGRDAPDALHASVILATAAQDHRGALLSRAFLAVADPIPGAAAALDEIAAGFSSLGLPWEASLSRALARLKAGETAAAASLLRERPETSLLAQEILQATPEEAIKLLVPYLPIS
jgi:tetratricopeptide (TPR) repeat protein